MKDIVEEGFEAVKQIADDFPQLGELIKAMALEIERLREENKFTKAADHAALLTRITELEAQIESLEAAIEGTWVPQVERLEGALHLARPMVGRLANDAEPEVMQVIAKIDAALNKEQSCVIHARML